MKERELYYIFNIEKCTHRQTGTHTHTHDDGKYSQTKPQAKIKDRKAELELHMLFSKET